MWVMSCRPVWGSGPTRTGDQAGVRTRWGHRTPVIRRRSDAGLARRGGRQGPIAPRRGNPRGRAVPSGMPRACAARAARRDSLRAPAGDLWPATSHGRRRSRAQQKGPPWLPPPPPRRPRRPSRPRTTPPATSRSSRASRPCASARACTSAPPTAAASCTASGRSSTTRSTRPSPACATDIEVILYRDGSVEVRDNGRGIPVDIEPRTGLTGVEVVFTKLHAGGKFGGGSYAASGGLHGVGASVVNALSARLDVEVDRGGKTYAMSFRRGEPGVFPDARTGRPGPRPRVHPLREDPASCAVVGKAKRGRDRHAGPLLGRPADLPQGRRLRLRRSCSRRARQTSFLVPGLTPGHPRRARLPGHPRRGRPARGDLPARRRHHRVRRVPRPRPGRDRRLAAARGRAPSPRRCRCSTTRGT